MRTKPYITKKESNKVERLAKKLAKVLNELDRKYWDENEFWPTADLYAKAYVAMQKLEDEMVRWMA